jgi:hypothetical protein
MTALVSGLILGYYIDIIAQAQQLQSKRGFVFMKKLPIGISTLKEIIEENYTYVDKTDVALKLIDEGKYYFLSRPRRFGKSLFLDTLKEIFQGNKELFRGLYIYDKYEFTSYPVIRISFNDGVFKSSASIEQSIYQILDFNQRALGIECPKGLNIPGCFRRMIEEAYKKYNQKVVILIDEYDKPILDNLDQKEVAREAREILKNFYSIIKGADEFLKFAFLTGVSKFSKVSLFSGLNNLNDITVDKHYSTICGYTQKDVEVEFEEHLKGQDFEKIKEWYNGYKWLGESVYNPFDILLFINKGYVYSNYWFSTATPTFLLKIIEQNNYFLPNLERVVADSMMLDSFDIDDIRLEVLMWQTGYLTIVDSKEGIKGDRYILDIPNKEVQISLLGTISDYITKNHHSVLEQEYIYEALVEPDFKKFEKNLSALFASIGYSNFTKNKLYEYEGYYVSVFYTYLKALGVRLIAEDITSRGRIDLSIELPNAIYIMEFKVDSSGALKQIEDMEYHTKHIDRDKPIYLVGIEFDSKKRSVSKVEVKKLDDGY